MEYFTEEHAALMFGTEWLVKVDPDQSKSYLLKFSMDSDGKCCIMITDTVHLWAEVLSSPQFMRRWAICNPSRSTTSSDNAHTRKEALRLVTAAHTIGGVSEMEFTFSESPSCDACVSLECDTGSPPTSWSWRWETFSTGPKLSAQILSQHLIMPLISGMHLAFQSADHVNEMADADLEKAVDKLARTARRAMDTHMKQAMSKPRTATALRRITAMVHDVKLLPVLSEVEDIDVSMKKEGPLATTNPTADHQPVSDVMYPTSHQPSPSPKAAVPEAITVEDSPPPRPRAKPVHRAEKLDLPAGEPLHPISSTPLVVSDGDGENDIEMRPAASGSETEDSDNEIILARPKASDPISPVATAKPLAGSSSAKPPPSKKAKAASSSDDDSEAERKQHVARMVASSKRGGARQPLKRGGKRF